MAAARKPAARVLPTPAAARPFLKWAGGKGQLLEKLSAYFPKALADGSIHTYLEPFMGGGAVFFHIMRNYPIKFAHLRDANPELVLVYQVVKRDLEALIETLGQMERDYLKLGESKRRERYLKVREAFNRAHAGQQFGTYSIDWVGRAAQIIFLNKTCYNGLFRVNSKGGFNVPFGSYVKPTILDIPNLRAASSLLAKAEITLGDFGELGGKAARIKPGTFIYYDPPYRPLSRTASFTAYSREAFDDEDQRRLAKLFKDLHRPGVFQMMSNSDPKNTDPGDDFFEETYADFQANIFRIPAARSINSNGAGRGRIQEIVITSYKA